MTYKFIADENVDYHVIKELRSSGYDIISILEDYRGAKDEDIIDLASRESRILITNDTDFGWLIYRMGYTHSGVILLRLNDHSAGNIMRVLLDIIEDTSYRIEDSFVVATENKIRIRRRYIDSV